MTQPLRPPPPRPIAPSDEDCCRSDCPNCVFTLHERELARWEEQMEAWQQAAEKAAADSDPRPAS